jgi:hypothetical protein
MGHMKFEPTQPKTILENNIELKQALVTAVVPIKKTYCLMKL